MIYGTGYITWEWHPAVALRSAFHPLIYAIIFWIFKLFKLDYSFVINLIPNVLQAFLFAAADVCYLSFLKKFFYSNEEG